MVLSLVLLTFLLNSLVHSFQTKGFEWKNPNWTSFQISSGANHSLSTALVSQFPIFSYWDLLKGSFRTGIIRSDFFSSILSGSSSEKFRSIPHNFSIQVSKRINHRGSQFAVLQDIIDTSQVFMHLLVSVQSLSKEVDQLSSQVNIQDPSTKSLTEISLHRFYLHKREDTAEISWSLKNLTSSSQVALLKEIAQLQLDSKRLMAQLESLRHQLNLRLLKERFTVNKEQIYASSREILDLLLQFNRSIETETLRTFRAISLQIEDLHQREVSNIQMTNELEVTQSLRRFDEELREKSKLIAFRLEQERELLELQFQQQQSFAQLQSQDLMRKNQVLVQIVFEEMIEKLFSELFSLDSSDSAADSSSFFSNSPESEPRPTSLRSLEDVWKLVLYLRSLFLLRLQPLRRYLFLPKQSFLNFACYTTAFFLLLLLFVELLRSLQLILYKYYFQKQQLYSQEAYRPLWPLSRLFFWTRSVSLFSARTKKQEEEEEEASRQFLREAHSLIFSREEEQALLRVLREYDLCLQPLSLQPRLCLKNYLFYGEPGCGKSTAVSAVLSYLRRRHSLSAALIRISGSDLLSLGSLSGHYIQDLLSSQQFRRQPLLLVLDECDAIIAQRAAAETETETKQRKMVQTTIFSLLEGLRRPSAFLSVIFCTRLTMKEIDSALLDRIDETLHFSLPQRKERLRYLLRTMDFQLIDFLSEEEKSLLRQFQQSLSDVDDEEEGDGVERLFDSTGDSLLIQQWQQCFSPELDHPFSHSSPAVRNVKLSRETLRSFLSEHLQDFSLEGFQFVCCVQVFLFLSDHWSFRDLHKKLLNIRYRVLCSERCRLTSQIWLRELLYQE